MKKAHKHKATFVIGGRKMSLRIMTEWYMRKSSCRFLCTTEHKPHDPEYEQEFFNIYENLLTGEYFAVKVWQ